MSNISFMSTWSIRYFVLMIQLLIFSIYADVWKINEWKTSRPKTKQLNWLTPTVTTCVQWRNRRGRGGEVPPETSDREISANLTGKKWQGKMVKGAKIEKKRKKIEKAKVEIENGRWKSYKMRRGPSFFFFFLLTVFSKPLKFVLGLPKWKFSTVKTGKKIQEKWLCPLRKIFLLRSCLCKITDKYHLICS